MVMDGSMVCGLWFGYRGINNKQKTKNNKLLIPPTLHNSQIFLSTIQRCLSLVRFLLDNVMNTFIVFSHESNYILCIDNAGSENGTLIFFLSSRGRYFVFHMNRKETIWVLLRDVDGLCATVVQIARV